MSLVEPNEDSARQRLRQALHQAPLFADLDSTAMAAVERELSLLVLPGGAPLFHSGEPADAVTVSDLLNKRGELARVGGPSYLHTLIASVPTAATAASSCGRVASSTISQYSASAGSCRSTRR